ncbi:MAG: hypothetical protein M3Z31_11905 [Pseudomonadota bacterium]|nr:hypothetical protein [Pseudomonadota bacterium]
MATTAVDLITVLQLLRFALTQTVVEPSLVTITRQSFDSDCNTQRQFRVVENYAGHHHAITDLYFANVGRARVPFESRRKALKRNVTGTTISPPLITTDTTAHGGASSTRWSQRQSLSG